MALCSVLDRHGEARYSVRSRHILAACQQSAAAGVSVLERFVTHVRQRVETRVCRLLGDNLSTEQKERLEALLLVPEGSRSSVLDQLRSGPVMVSVPALLRAVERLQKVRGLGITSSAASLIPPSRIASLARFANTAKVTAVANLPPARRLVPWWRSFTRWKQRPGRHARSLRAALAGVVQQGEEGRPGGAHAQPEGPRCRGNHAGRGVRGHARCDAPR